MKSFALFARLALPLAATLAVGCGGVSQSDDVDAATGGGDASVDAPIDASADAAAARHVVFTTSTTMTGGQFQSRDGVSNECQRLADLAGLQGNFVALLHLRTEPIDNAYIQIQGPVANTNGDIVAADAAAFFAGAFTASNEFNESGGAPGDTIAWVGDPSTGITCGDWGSTAAGQGGQTDTRSLTWLNAVSNGQCTLSRSAQCISQ